MFHGLDTLTPEQANDILIGHQKSPDKGLGEVIICYKIIQMVGLAENWTKVAPPIIPLSVIIKKFKERLDKIIAREG